jgi:hypothetical protein
MREQIVREAGERVFRFVNYFVNLKSRKGLVISTASLFNIEKHQKLSLEFLINLKRINDIRYITEFFNAANEKLISGGIFIGCVETKDLRKERVLNKFIPPFNYIYYFFDFIIKRIFPKFPVTKTIYFFLTRGQNRVISRAEALGRLIYSGFEVVTESYLDKHLYFVARKSGPPINGSHPSYGPLAVLERVGRHGKIIRVYKLRTMHPYSEYLQEYIYKLHRLDAKGKISNDFRVTTLGRFFRKFWLDELPMFLNLLKGDMKLVGVRPLSRHYFGLYSKELQEKRIRYRPGLIPPYYADMPRNLQEIMDSEMRYLDAYEKKPFRTTVRYFFKAVYNILIRRARSN